MSEAIANGSESDLDRVEELYRDHADFVHAAILRLGGPAVDADDLTQEVFLVALRKWTRLPPGADPRAWLYGVAARAVSEARRKAAWRRRLGLANPPPNSQWFDTEPDTGLQRRDAQATFYRLIERMSEKKRTAFLLFEIEGLSGEEVAALVRAPLKTVWTRLHHARREFLKALELERKREP
jgi:RNA polymerase sigma-70 factor (ECF subfamily)